MDKPRLIDANALFERVKAIFAYDMSKPNGGLCADAFAALTAIENAPTVDAELEAAKSGWISVEDRLPENLNEILVYGRHRNDNYDYSIGFSIPWLKVLASKELEVITHWQPLPEPPTDGKNGGIKNVLN